MPTAFTEEVIKIILAIPEGKVLTYGTIAAMAGNPQGSRQVSRILHSSSRKYNLPWHRVVNAQGGISLPSGGREIQKDRLEKEGVQFNKNGRIDLSVYMAVNLKIT